MDEADAIVSVLLATTRHDMPTSDDEMYQRGYSDGRFRQRRRRSGFLMRPLSDSEARVRRSDAKLILAQILVERQPGYFAAMVAEGHRHRPASSTIYLHDDAKSDRPWSIEAIAALRTPDFEGGHSNAVIIA